MSVCSSCDQNNDIDPRVKLGMEIKTAGVLLASIGGILSVIGLLMMWKK